MITAWRMIRAVEIKLTTPIISGEGKSAAMTSKNMMDTKMEIELEIRFISMILSIEITQQDLLCSKVKLNLKH